MRPGARFVGRLAAVVCALALGYGAAAGAEPAPLLPAISLIIDDLGDRLPEGSRAVALPGAVTCAFLPHSPHARALAQRAHAAGKEIMVHLPMQAMEGQLLGPGALTLDMTEGEFGRTLQAALDAVPHVRGVNNHMGSLLTRHPGHMAWLMQGLTAYGRLFFVDSRTTDATVAQRLAAEHGIASAARDVFLDNVQEHAAVRRQFEQLLAKARRHGGAVGIAHPYPATLDVLEAELSTLARRGVRLVPVSELISLQDSGREKLWQASLSP